MSILSINTATIAGEVTDPPRFRETQGGQVCEVRIKTTETNAKQGRTFDTWHTVTVWGDRAAQINNSLKPGMSLYASGRIRHSSYTNNNGEKVNKAEIVAKDIAILGTNNTGNNNTGNGYQSAGNNNSGGFDSGPIPF